MLKKCIDPHAELAGAIAELHVNGQQAMVVKSRLSTVRASARLVRLLLVLASMALMVVDIWRASFSRQYVVVREFWNIPLLCFAILIFPLRGRVLFNVNHNLSCLPYHFPRSISLLGFLGFRFILFDGQAAAQYFPRSVRNAFVFPLFPCSPRGDQEIVASSIVKPKPVVAIVGDLRPEKGDPTQISEVLSSLALAARWDIRLGYRHQAHMLARLPATIRLVDTDSRSKYFELLSAADVIVVFAERGSYFCRHSGTVMDAIACGAVPLVPELPVLVSQISNPVLVGVTYQTFKELEEGISRAIALSQVVEEQRNLYFSVRRSVNVSLP